MSFFSDIERELVVAARVPLARDVVALELVAPNGRDLPAWTPGSHIDVVIGPGIERQYSLCGEPTERARWRIAVLREPGGAGGSVRLHEGPAVGEHLRVRGPRNHFPLEVGSASPYRFVAGGIGITALLPMVAAVDAAGDPWELHYCGRSRATMAFLDELLVRYPEHIAVYAADEGRRFDVAGLQPGPVTYACGPARLLTALEEHLGAAGGVVHAERFTARELLPPVRSEPFEVELAVTGTTITVPPEQSVLAAMEAEGVPVLSSCRQGTCGSCEVVVLEGEVEHRDSVLAPDSAAGVMMVCVSRALSDRLVLDA